MRANRIKVADLKAWLDTQPDTFWVFTDEEGVSIWDGWEVIDRLTVNNEPFDDSDAH